MRIPMLDRHLPPKRQLYVQPMIDVHTLFTRNIAPPGDGDRMACPAREANPSYAVAPPKIFFRAGRGRWR